MPAYNNYFPIGYQPMQYPQQQTTSITWVQGESGAKAYPVAAGNSMLLMDSESERFFIKTTDVSGMPMPLRIYSYSEVVEQAPEIKSDKHLQLDKYITRNELEERLEDLKSTLGAKSKRRLIEDE